MTNSQIFKNNHKTNEIQKPSSGDNYEPNFYGSKKTWSKLCVFASVEMKWCWWINNSQENAEYPELLCLTFSTLTFTSIEYYSVLNVEVSKNPTMNAQTIYLLRVSTMMNKMKMVVGEDGVHFVLVGGEMGSGRTTTQWWQRVSLRRRRPSQRPGRTPRASSSCPTQLTCVGRICQAWWPRWRW